MTRRGRARDVAAALLLACVLATTVPATSSAGKGKAPAMPVLAAEPCGHCPDSVTTGDGTPGVALTGRLTRVGDNVVLDGCAGHITLEGIQGEFVEPLVGHDVWLNSLCTGKDRVAALGGHMMGDSVVDLFVMSLCPYGRALERQICADMALADSLRRPPVRVHWLLYEGNDASGQVLYSRHGAGELAEDVVQMTVRELEPDKLWPYISARTGTDTTWTVLASRVGLGWRTLTEIQRRLDHEVQLRAHAAWLETVLNWPHVDESPTIFWMGRQVRDIADVPGFKKAKMPTESCKN